jgi:hypothetical protein
MRRGYGGLRVVRVYSRGMLCRKRVAENTEYPKIGKNAAYSSIREQYRALEHC